MTVQENDDSQSEPGDRDAIRFLARTLDDLERLRIGTDNRVRAATDEGNDLPPALPALAESLREQEHHIRLALEKTWRKDPLYPWAASIVGLKSGTLMPRLLAELGDPYIATPMAGFRTPEGGWTVVADGEPYARTVRQLWRYCALGDPADKQRRGMTEDEARAGGRRLLKKRVWLIADQFIRHRSEPYRSLYDAEKQAKVDAEWKLGHAENHARRMVMKAFLRDLWEAARAVQIRPDDHEGTGGVDAESGAAHHADDGHSALGRSRDLATA